MLSTIDWQVLSLRLFTRSSNCSTVMSLLSQISSAIDFQIELIISLFWSKFSGLGSLLMNISPADLNLP